MDSEALKLVKQAEAKQNTGFFGRLFSSKESRLEECLDLYEKAAGIYKLNKKWEEAAKLYEKCAQIQLDIKGEPTQYYIDAAHCYSFVDSLKLIENLKRAVSSYVNQGRFQLAGRIQKKVSEKLEEDLNYDGAAEAYKKAGDYFAMESMHSKSDEQTCLLKFADLSSISNNPKCYPEACQVRFYFNSLKRFTKK